MSISIQFEYQRGEMRESLAAFARQCRQKISRSPSSFSKETKPSRRFWILVAIIAILAVCTVMPFQNVKAGRVLMGLLNAPTTPWIILGIFLLVLLRPTVWLLNYRRAKSADIMMRGVACRMTADDQGIVWDDSKGPTPHAWQSITSFDETQNLFNLYHADPAIPLNARVFTIPKRAFPTPESLDEFKGLISAYVPRNT